jgi:hypothetical protein
MARRNTKPERPTRRTEANFFLASLPRRFSIRENHEAAIPGHAKDSPRTIAVRPPSSSVRVAACSGVPGLDINIMILCIHSKMDALDSIENHEGSTRGGSVIAAHAQEESKG